MGITSDLLHPGLLQPTATPPALLVATVLDIDPLRVTVASFDNSRTAYRAFGTFPDAVAGDEMRVQLDEYGGLTAVAWEPQP
jgi:hypothetical protein